MFVCANCKEKYVEGDRYCRYCGAPMGKPLKIRDTIRQCIYGPPPMTRKHICTVCGYTWETRLMMDNERWCPQCGGDAPVAGGDRRRGRVGLPYRGRRGASDQ